MRQIDTSILASHHCCEDGIVGFKRTFGDVSVDVTVENAAKVFKVVDLRWAVMNLLTDAQRFNYLDWLKYYQVKTRGVRVASWVKAYNNEVCQR